MSRATTRYGRYEIVRRLGHGAMGEVFEGRHVELGTRVAIKVIHSSAGAEAMRRVLREGRAAAAIRHPHVVAMLDVGMATTPFLVMELLEGEDLGKRLAREGPLGLGPTVDLVIPIASAVSAAHAAGVVHRDLKPSNVFLARRHMAVEPVVVDFGVSRLQSPIGDSTKSSRGGAGTPQYMAPEVLRRPESVGPQSDQYSLAVLVYECVTGGTLFWNEDRYELLHAIMTAPVVPPSEINPVLPAAFDGVLLRALARDPAARFASVRAFGAALLPFASADVRAKWATELGDRDASSGGFAVRASPAPARWNGGLWAGCAALALAATTVVEARVSSRQAAGEGAARVSPTTFAIASSGMTSAAPSNGAASGASGDVTRPAPPTSVVPPASPPSSALDGRGPATVTNRRSGAWAEDRVDREMTEPRGSPARTGAPNGGPPPFAAPLERGTGGIPILE